jgi:hypothetical protein
MPVYPGARTPIYLHQPAANGDYELWVSTPSERIFRSIVSRMGRLPIREFPFRHLWLSGSTQDSNAQIRAEELEEGRNCVTLLRISALLNIANSYDASGYYFNRPLTIKIKFFSYLPIFF